MDIEFEYQGIRFRANRVKKASNPKKHDGVTFEQAAEALLDPFVKVVDASRHGEARDAAIGYDAASKLLFVVHIVQEDDAIRLISARKATLDERYDYEN